MSKSDPKHSSIIFYVNGRKIVEHNVDPSTVLLTYLRKTLGLCGTKRGCNEGGCGSCTVMVSKLDQRNGKIRHYSVNACLAPIGTMHGLAVTTVEGVGSTKTKLHPVQERLAKAHGSQCGFCTPGFVMSMYTLLRNNPQPTMEEIEENLLGNLCRCTGYRPILEGFRTFTKDFASSGCGLEDCCKLKQTENCIDNREIEGTTVLFDPKDFAPYHPSQDLIFPPDLQIKSEELLSQNLFLEGRRQIFHKVSSLEDLLCLKDRFPEAKVMVGHTLRGIVKTKENEYPERVLYPSDVPELRNIKICDSWIEFGSAITISEIEEELKKILKREPESKTKNFRSILEMLPWFADKQIRNVASLGGNLMSNLSISDFNCVLMASEATLLFRSKENERELKADGEFFANKNEILKNGKEVLVSVRIPFTTENEFFKSFKHSHRRGKDLSVVNAAFKVTLKFPSLEIASMIVAVGGVAKTTITADKTANKVVGLTWDESFLETGISALIDEMKTLPSQGSPDQYKIALAASFFFKFYLFVCEQIEKQFPGLGPPLKGDESEVILPFKKTPTKSMQFFQDVPEDQEKIDPVGRPIPHVSALKQTTGEAIYVDDIPHSENGLHAALVLSKKARAKIVNVDASEALKMEGVEGFFSANDLPESQNKTGFVDLDEEVFASTEVRFVGQIIGVVVAVEEDLARLAAAKIVVQYDEIQEPILTIEKAIEENSVWDPCKIECGNVDKGLEDSTHVLEGESRIGGQEHFYLEPNAHIVIPSEDGEVEVIGSMQYPAAMQRLVSRALGVDFNRVTCKAKRVGGAFGGKEVRNIYVALPVAVAASKTQRPVRIVLTRGEDMTITGGRHPVLAKWKVGFDEDGLIKALQVKYYLNAGFSSDYSIYVGQSLLLDANGAYNISNVRIISQCCKTNLASNTAFRGFGSPQAIFFIENILSQVADYLRKSPIQVRERNMYTKEPATTPCGQELTNITLRDCWDQVISSSNFEERKSSVDEFNRNNIYKKRGIAAMPLKFGVGFFAPCACQGGALVHVYLDGSVLVTHGGVELGQGLHTKVLQIASRVLQLPMSKIYIAETDTSKVPNASSTAASVSSDLYGAAVLEACTKIVTRLKPYRTNSSSWEEAVFTAYMDRVSLSATGFFKMLETSEYKFDEGKPASPFVYYSYGASVSEVEINCLTGEHLVLRTDIVMDVGKSLNPAIDIGQIEGAFAQGYGLYTLEQLCYSSSGELLTKGPNQYKVPCVLNIPREFNVTLLRDSVNERAVYSSKAIGEPPLLTGVSVFLAIREAVKAARNEDQLTIQFDSPATAEKIRMACQDWITKKISNNN